MTAQLATAQAARSAVRIGEQLRAWRPRRRLCQLDLACGAEISTRHLSCVETGRAAPSREMVSRLAERLEVALRGRDVLLMAAGFAPSFQPRSLDDPALAAAVRAIELVLKAHAPHPALAIDRLGNLLSANRLVMPLLAGLSPKRLAPPLNVLRLASDPGGLVSHTVNLGEWCAHPLERPHRPCEATADPGLLRLYQELRASPVPARPVRSRPMLSRCHSGCGCKARCWACSRPSWYSAHRSISRGRRLPSRRSFRLMTLPPRGRGRGRRHSPDGLVGSTPAAYL